MPVKQRLRPATVVAVAVASTFLATGSSQSDEEALRAMAERFNAAQHCTSGAISVGYIDNGTGSLFSVGTVSAHRGSPRAIRGNDEFAIGSITKTFTATLYALALSEGKVKPDTPAQDVMPAGVRLPVYRTSAGKEIPITLDNLARHSSGLPRGFQPFSGSLSRQQMISELPSAQLEFAPGTGFLYSNLGFAVLSLAMERIYGEAIETLLTEKVAVPVGMSKTAIDLGGLPSDGVLDGYRPNGAPAPEHPPTAPAFDGANGLRSTPLDMMQFLRFNMKLSSVGELSAALPMLQKTETLRGVGDAASRTIGLAWQTATLPDGRRLVWKDGNVPGFRSFIGFTTSPPITGTVVLSTQNGCRVTKLGRCVIESLSHARADEYCANPDAGIEQGFRSPRGHPGSESDEP
jgi:serine-type D-Ala-D-Ala carboxypeptidase/endopeptidase